MTTKRELLSCKIGWLSTKDIPAKEKTNKMIEFAESIGVSKDEALVLFADLAITIHGGKI